MKSLHESIVNICHSLPLNTNKLYVEVTNKSGCDIYFPVDNARQAEKIKYIMNVYFESHPDEHDIVYED